MSDKTSRRELARVFTAKLLAEPDRQKYWLQALAAYLVDKKMSGEADMLINDIAHELFEQTGQLTVEVTSAQELTGAVRSKLQAFLKQKTGAEAVNLHESVDGDLIGGLVARTPDAELDVSVQRSLRKLTALA